MSFPADSETFRETTASAVARVMREVQADCKQDATALDSTSFTPRGVGEALGNALAMVSAVARAVELLALDTGDRQSVASREERS